MRQDIEDVLLAEQLIDAATLAIEGYTGKIFVQRTITAEQHAAGGNGADRGGAKRMHLRYYPIVSVTSISDDQTTPATVAGTDYTILGDIGALEHDSSWPVPIYRWNVTYVAGRFATMDLVTDDLRLACNMQAADWYRNQPSSIMSRSKGDNSESFLVTDDELLPRVRSLLNRYKQVDI
jgi:hypothetical protein